MLYYIRLRKGSTVIGNTYCSTNITESIKSRYEDDLKEKAEEYPIDIYVEGEWVDAQKYFEESGEETEDTTEEKTTTQEQEEIEEDAVEEETEEDYSELFEGQWRSQVKKIKEYTNDPDELQKIIDYGEENDELDSVLSRVKEYKEELE